MQIKELPVVDFLEAKILYLAYYMHPNYGFGTPEAWNGQFKKFDISPDLGEWRFLIRLFM